MGTSKAFLPGERLQQVACEAGAQEAAVVGLSCFRGRSAGIAVPGRAGLAVCDMRTFCPGTPGGGGLCLSLALYTEACVRLLGPGASDDLIRSDRPLVIRHALAAFRRQLGLAPAGARFEVLTRPGFDAHSGLGSTSGAVLAALAGANECLGSPLDLEVLRLLAGRNFVEEDEGQPGAVRFGWETGMAGMGATGGGLFLLSKELLLLKRFPEFGRGKAVYIIFPDNKKQAIHCEEDQTLAEATTSDELAAQKKAHIIMMQIAPAAARGDVAEVGRHVWDMQVAGSKLNEIRAFPGLEGFMKAAHATLRPDLLAMSSVGPATVVIADPGPQAMAAVQQLAQQHGCALKYSTAVDHVGLRCLPPRLVVVVGPPGAGKTTLCQALAAQLGGQAEHVAVSGLIREFIAANAGSEAAQALLRIQAAGEVRDHQPEGTTTSLVLDQIFQLQCGAASSATSSRAGSSCLSEPQPVTVLLDGFPRSPEQAEAFEQRSGLFGARAAAVALRCGAATTQRRMAARGREAAAGGPSGAARLGRDETQAVVQYVQSKPGSYAVVEVDAERGAKEVAADVAMRLSSL